MDENTIAIYVHELRNLCVHTQASFDMFNNAVINQVPAGILFSSQMILVPVSQIAAILWPTRARSRSRGEHLRKLLQLPEKHVFSDRRISELWERGDEKTDEWIQSTKGQKVIFDFVGNPAQLGADVRASGIYRAYDPATKVFYYRGTGYNFQALAQALMDIAPRVNALYRHMFPEQAKAEDEARQRAAAAAQKRAEDANAAAAAANTAAAEMAEPAASTAADAPAETKAAKKPAAKKADASTTTAKAPAKKPAAKKAAPKKATAKKADA